VVAGVLLAERPNGDFAMTMVRQFLYEAWAFPMWELLAARSSDEAIRGVAGKAVKESAYHLRHTGTWIIRLGDGTEESIRRAQDAFDALWPYSHELLADDEVDYAAADAGVGVLNSDVAEQWQEALSWVMDSTDLNMPEPVVAQLGGKSGLHTEQLGFILAEMQHLRQAHAGAQW
jgi:ring-1,2-phenylacetyl-CoA epoxidase subunit PaaC